MEENKEEQEKDFNHEITDNERLVTIYKTGSDSVAFVIKSLLEEAGIKYLLKNEGLQALFGIGTIGTGFNPITGPMIFQVMPEDEEEAKELLKDVEEADDKPLPE